MQTGSHARINEGKRTPEQNAALAKWQREDIAQTIDENARFAALAFDATRRTQIKQKCNLIRARLGLPRYSAGTRSERQFSAWYGYGVGGHASADQPDRVGLWLDGGRVIRVRHWNKLGRAVQSWELS